MSINFYTPEWLESLNKSTYLRFEYATRFTKSGKCHHAISFSGGLQASGYFPCFIFKDLKHREIESLIKDALKGISKLQLVENGIDPFTATTDVESRLRVFACIGSDTPMTAKVATEWQKFQEFLDLQIAIDKREEAAWNAVEEKLLEEERKKEDELGQQ